MNWRVGFALVLLLVILFSVLHLAYSTMPARHTPPPPQERGLPALSPGPRTPEYGQIGYATMNNFRPMNENYKKVSPPFKFSMDASGNVLYPY